MLVRRADRLHRQNHHRQVNGQQSAGRVDNTLVDDHVGRKRQMGAVLLNGRDRQYRQGVTQRAVDKIVRRQFSPLRREVRQTRYLSGRREPCQRCTDIVCQPSYRTAGNDTDPAGVLSMFIDRLDEEDQPETPAKDPKADERPANMIDANLFKSRTVLLFGEINDKVARAITAQLIALSSDSDKPIRMFINSPGGHVESGDTIFDIIRFVRAPVQVIGTGWVASAGALIFIAAKKENRFCLPNTRFMLHQPSGGTMGKASDIAIEAKEIIRMRQRLNETFARETGQPLEKVTRDTERNYWMSGEEAVAYGLASKVITLATELD